MANSTGTPIPATAVNQDASQTPGAPALPFALPETMTAEMAQGRLAELKSDHDWQTRWLAGDERASTEFDQLTRRAVNQRPATPTPVPDENAQALRALGAPAKPEDYRIDVRDPTTGWPVRIDAHEKAVIDAVLLPPSGANRRCAIFGVMTTSKASRIYSTRWRRNRRFATYYSTIATR